jgi:diguanylate cyclase (GGDEF)-like protein/PAS domain S-box-containing protein
MLKLDDTEIFRAVLDSLQTGVYIVDEDRRIVFWNDGAERISGFLRQDVVGRFCRDNILVHCDENHSILCGDGCPLTDTMRDGKPRGIDVYLRHKEGYRVPVKVWAVPVRDQDGRIVGAAESFEARAVAANEEHRRSRVAGEECLGEGAGLVDRDLLRARLSKSLITFVERRVPFSVLRVQVDQWDHWQQRYGHLAAKAILSVVGQTLSNTVRPVDMVGRWNESGFLAIIAYCTADMLENVNALLKKIVKSAGIEWWGDRLSVTVSVGGASVDSGDQIDSILQRAEKSLQQNISKDGDCALAVQEVK